MRHIDTFPVLFQALTSWKSPFTGAGSVTSGTPVTGLKHGFCNYGTRYFELYLTDVNFSGFKADLNNWKTILENNDHTVCN